MAPIESTNDLVSIYADLRSASRAQQRTSKYSKRYINPSSVFSTGDTTHPSQQPHYTFSHYSGLVSESTHRTRKRHSNYNKRTWTKALSQKVDVHLAIAQFVREIEQIYWHGRFDLQGDDDWIKDITDGEWEGGNWSEWCMQQGATWENVRVWEPWTEIGETFPKWAQRRINEMRSVKEDRLRAKLAGTLPEKMKTDGSLGTTLPTTPGDIDGHANLEYVMRPPWRRKGVKFPLVHGYGWFDEYEWYWHRNETGCFELTSWVKHSQCYCELYAPCGRWSPEDRVQPYTLGEFIFAPGCEEELENKGVKGMCEYVDSAHVEFLEGVPEVEWNIISLPTMISSPSRSSSWSIIEQDQ